VRVVMFRRTLNEKRTAVQKMESGAETRLNPPALNGEKSKAIFFPLGFSPGNGPIVDSAVTLRPGPLAFLKKLASLRDWIGSPVASPS
jgi:hypothetical protein